MSAAAAVFVVMLAIIVGAYWMFVVRPEEREEQALRQRVKPTEKRPRRTDVVKPAEKLSAVGLLESMLAPRASALAPLRNLIARSGRNATVGSVLLMCGFSAVLVFALGLWLSGPVLLCAAASVIAAWLPVLYLRRSASKRLARFEELFPEAIDLLARALRAGHALTTGLQMVGDEIDEPVGGEFRTLFEQQNYGMSLAEALRQFALRVPIVDARFFVTALLTQRESGGNLSEILDKLASVIRERFRVKRQVRVISAHGRMTGFTLGLLPPTLAAILLVISPTHMALLTKDPIGIDMIGVAVVLQIVGTLIIRRIVDVEY